MEECRASLLSFAEKIVTGDKAWSAPELRTAFAKRLHGGEDPLGEKYCSLTTAEERRPKGIVLTPACIVSAMIDWALRQAETSGQPERIVDAGAGTGRFTLAAASAFPNATILAVESDPELALLLKANVKEAGVGDRVSVLCRDFRSIFLRRIAGPTLFLGNPPYIRHHEISAAWKHWYVDTCARHRVKASQLAGMHLHFFAKIAELGIKGDYGCLITASEWLDVGYGAALRSLLADGLGGAEIHVLEPTAEAFPGTMTTATVTGFLIGSRPPQLRLRSVSTPAELGRLEGGRSVDWEDVEKAPKWSILIRSTPKPQPGTVELGELCKVHRGQVTGANRIWTAGSYSRNLPQSVLKPTVTRAAELFAAGPSLDDDTQLARVIDLPVNLDEIAPEHRPAVFEFLRWAKSAGAADGYIARHRSPWWAIRLPEPAPIICTYMARRPPAFVRNRVRARLLNIAHGIYPREQLSEEALARLVGLLSNAVHCHQGRTYAGGLTKFEPGEIERIPIAWPS